MFATIFGEIKFLYTTRRASKSAPFEEVAYFAAKCLVERFCLPAISIHQLSRQDKEFFTTLLQKNLNIKNVVADFVNEKSVLFAINCKVAYFEPPFAGLRGNIHVSSSWKARDGLTIGNN